MGMPAICHDGCMSIDFVHGHLNLVGTIVEGLQCRGQCGEMEGTIFQPREERTADCKFEEAGDVGVVLQGEHS